MKRYKEDQFLRWAQSKGIVLDPKYPKAAVLSSDPPADEHRFWVVPPQPEMRSFFIASLLELAGGDSFFCWRHLGRWPETPEPWVPENGQIEYQILNGIGLGIGSTDIVEFRRDEIHKLTTLVFSTTIFGWSVEEDLYIIPDHARQILQTDHHGVIHVSCRSAADMQRFIAGMREDGYELPRKVPDATFKTPKWMEPD